MMKTMNLLYTILIGLILIACALDDGPGDIMPDPINKAPIVFKLISIEDKWAGVDFMPAFRWEAAPDPDGDTVTYDFFLAKENQDFEPLGTDLTSTLYQIDESLEFFTDYRWMVTAKDSKGGVTESNIRTFKTRQLSTAKVVVASTAFESRKYHNLISFNDKLLLMGGEKIGAFDYAKDIWLSDDGIQWQEVTSNAPFGHRRLHSTIVFQDRLFVVGGTSSEPGSLGSLEKLVVTNDVWSSTNGSDWNREQSNADFSKRAGHAMVHYNGKLWLLGGADNSGFRNDVYMSEDGADWDLVNATADFSPRAFAQCVAFDGKLWLIGGRDDSNVFNDIWQSEDGLNWTQLTITANFPPRIAPFNAFVFHNSIMVVGGEHQNEVWYSRDGMVWKVLTQSAPYGERKGMVATVQNNKIYLVGGQEDNTYKNDVWLID